MSEVLTQAERLRVNHELQQLVGRDFAGNAPDAAMCVMFGVKCELGATVC